MNINSALGDLPSCGKRGHYNSLKNIVCVAQSCKNRGLICIYCLQTDHVQHRFMGVEKFVEIVLESRAEISQPLRRTSNLRNQLDRRYRHLQLKISELASNLEILTHQVKFKYEEDIGLIEKQARLLQERQNAFIFGEKSPSCGSIINDGRSQSTENQAISSLEKKGFVPSVDRNQEKKKSLEKFVEETMEFTNYQVQEGEDILQIGDFTRGLEQLDLYETRLNQIEEALNSTLKTVVSAQEQLLTNENHFFNNIIEQQLHPVEDSSPIHTKQLISAHSNRISNLILLKNNILFSASHDGFLKMWSLNSMKCLKVLKSSYSRLFLALLHLPSLKVLVALTNDNTLHLIDPDSLKILKKVMIPSKYSCCTLLVKVPGIDQQIAVAAGSKIFVIDIFTGNVVCSADTNGYYVYSFDIWSDGNYKYLIFGDKAGKLHAYEMKTNTEMPAIEKAHEDKIVDVKVLGKSNYIITASTDKQIKVWKMPVMQYIGGWESKGQVQGFASVQDYLVVKERDQLKLHSIYVDSKGSCKKKPFIKIDQPSEGAFIVNDITRSVITSSFKENAESAPSSDIIIEYY